MRRRRAIGAVIVLVAALSVGLNAGFHEPPRFDGAGYSVLALSLVRGQGYREIDRPDAPRHGHFPPGYPLALAGLWKITGVSVVAAHVSSMVCTVAAAWLAWRWLRRVEPRGVADLLGLAVAVNWMWGTVGGAIQSEPLYLLLSMIVLNVARARGWRGCLGLGILLGMCVLTRHAGVCLLVAVVIDRLCLVSPDTPHPNPPPQGGRGPERGGRRDRRGAAIVGLGAMAVISPWIYWLATVRQNTQVGLLDARGILPRVASQALFYARRIPDALAGPFVEVATVFMRARVTGIVATVVAIMISAVLVVGLIRSAADPRRRPAGLVPLVTLPLLLVWPFTEAGRFLIPLVPLLLVGAVEGLAWCLGVLRPSSPLLSPEGGSPESSPSPLEGEGRVGGEPGRRSAEAGVNEPAPSSSLPWPPPTLTLPLKGGGDQKGDQPIGSRRSARGRGGRWKSPRRIAALLVLLVAIPYPTYALLTRRAEAQRRSHADFDAACDWIVRDAGRAGPVLTRHPGEVFWQTGRRVVLPESDDLDALIRQIRDQKIAYILVDSDRFANAAPTPLSRLVLERPGVIRRVFGGPVAVDEVVSAP